MAKCGEWAASGVRGAISDGRRWAEGVVGKGRGATGARWRGDKKKIRATKRKKKREKRWGTMLLGFGGVDKKEIVMWVPLNSS